MRTANEIYENLEILWAEVKKLQDKIVREKQCWEEAFKRENEENLKDIDWLISNPTAPGQYEALRLYMKEVFGGEYMGVSASGYCHSDDYKVLEQNFGFYLDDYGKDKEEIERNVKKFVSDILPKLKFKHTVSSRWTDDFPEMEVIAIQYRSESSGLSYLFFQEETNSWYQGTLTYGSWDVLRKFKDFDEAFRTAFDEVNSKEREDDW